MTKLIIFLIGFLCGAITLMVWACILVGAEADKESQEAFNKLPNKIEVDHKEYDYARGCMDGFNDCIDYIKGENNGANNQE